MAETLSSSQPPEPDIRTRGQAFETLPGNSRDETKSRPRVSRRGATGKRMGCNYKSFLTIVHRGGSTRSATGDGSLRVS